MLITKFIIVVMVVYIWLAWRSLCRWWNKPKELEDCLGDYGLRGDLARFIYHAPVGSTLHIGTIYNEEYWERDGDKVRRRM